MGLLCTLAFLGCLILFVCGVSVWDKRATYQMMKTIDTGVNLAVEPEPEAIQSQAEKTQLQHNNEPERRQIVHTFPRLRDVSWPHGSVIAAPFAKKRCRPTGS